MVKHILFITVIIILMIPMDSYSCEDEDDLNDGLVPWVDIMPTGKGEWYYTKKYRERKLKEEKVHEKLNIK